MSRFDETEGAQPGECDDSTGFLPAHRFGALNALEGGEPEERKKDKKKGKVIVFDFDETITKSPKRMCHIAKALKAAGDEIVIVTGNEEGTKDLEQRLSDDYKFPYDRLIQYHDDETGGLQRKEVLKELDAWLGFDDRAGRAPVLCKVCPHLFLAAKPSKANKKAAKKAKDPEKVVEDEN